jgi:hypothetical protein
VVLAMDEVECTFDTSFRSDFFSMLRSWHNKRATKAIWKNVDLALVTSTEPYQLIENLNQSPFNVGQVIELTDFTTDQVQDLNQRHGGPLTASDLQSLMNLVNGHPYLVRKALYLLASDRLTAEEISDQAYNERSPLWGSPAVSPVSHLRQAGAEGVFSAGGARARAALMKISSFGCGGPGWCGGGITGPWCRDASCTPGTLSSI